MPGAVGNKRALACSGLTQGQCEPGPDTNTRNTQTHTHKHTHTHTHTRVTSAKGNHLQPPPPLSGTPIQGRSGTLRHLE